MGRNQVRKNKEFISLKFEKIRALEPYNAMGTKWMPEQTMQMFWPINDAGFRIRLVDKMNFILI